MFKCIVKDGRGKRIVTEIKRPDPAAVLVIEEGKTFEVSNAELNLLITLGYVDLPNVTLVGETGPERLKAVYPDAVVKEPDPVPPAPPAPLAPPAPVKK